MKKKTTKPAKKLMDIDSFELKYSEEIEIMTEAILDQLDNLNDSNYEDEYENAYEAATFIVASEKKIKLTEV
jgi:hypothetical protein